MVLWMEQFADKLISICMILCLIVSTIVFSTIMAIQVLNFSANLRLLRPFPTSLFRRCQRKISTGKEIFDKEIFLHCLLSSRNLLSSSIADEF